MALGLAVFVEGVTVHGHRVNEFGGFFSLPQEGTSLTWIWGHRIFTFGQLVLGLVELGTVLLVAMLVRRMSARADEDASPAGPSANVTE